MNGGIIAGVSSGVRDIRGAANSGRSNPPQKLGNLPGTDVTYKRGVMNRAASLANSVR
jgi:hypothetical protein